MHRRPLRVSAVLLVSLTLLLTMMSSTALAVEPSDLSGRALQSDGPPVDVVKSRSGRMAQTDPALLGRTDATPTFVFIKLDYDPVASYTGTETGFTATSPGLTGQPLRESDPAVGSYMAHITAKENSIVNSIEGAVPATRVLRSFRTVYGGVSAIVPANQVGALLSVPGVAAVQLDRRNSPTTDVTPDFIGASAVWPQLGGSTTAGEGVVVGVLDTGIWPEHPSLVNDDITYTGPELECDFGDGSDPDLGDAFECNDKLIGAYAFLDTYLIAEDVLEGEFCSDDLTECTARDANGHGTHTSTTAVGAPVDEAPIFGVDHGPVSGIAPGAHLVMYKVCLNEGCYQSDSVAAVEQAITDGVDVINFSIGGGESAFTDAVELAFLDAYAAGIAVNASAGNEGPGPGTVGHTGPWTNTVAASTSPRHFQTQLELSAAGASLSLTGATITDGVDPAADVVFAEDVPGYDDPLCATPLPDDSATGLVVACERGVVARVDKSFNVVPSGAVGMILYNFDPANGLGTVTDNHWLPTVHIDVDEGHDFVDFMTAHADTQARWDQATATAVTPDVMADFSSRGPLGDFLKPDITAPGVQILAGASPVPVGEGAGAPDQLFQAISGTSMASPHAAGVAALLTAAHPDWTPGQIKSAMMTSSVQSVLKEDGATTAGPFDRGAGALRANRAVAPTFTFDVGADEYAASASDPINRVHLNLPSIFADPMAGGLITQRTLENVSGSSRQVTVSASGASGSISVTPSSFVIPAGASQTIRITINGASLANGWYFGQVKLDVTGTATDAVLPVAFNKGPAVVTLDHSCSPSSVSVGTAADCEASATNLAPVPAAVSIVGSTSASSSTQLDITNVGAPGIESGNGFNWNGTLSAALAPEILSVEEGLTPAGYLPLSLFGITPLAGMGDETLVNFNTPEYTFGSEPYTSIAITSNGYAVVGGGEAEFDVNFIPQTFPDTDRPNNVLAPYWTDLDFNKGGAFRIGILGDGVNNWMVLEWEAVSTWDEEFVNSFQIWIGLNGEDDISYAYGTIGGPDAIGLTVGAENRDGTSGAEAGAPASGDELVVTAGSPTPGGTVTIPYDALGKGAGTYKIGATMTTDQSSSSTTKTATVTVTGIPGLPFNDIAGSRFLDDILWLNDQGITSGCSTNPPLFCPDGLVTRGQMATFLSRALGLPASPVDYFTDDNGSVHEPNINRIRHAGITVGCGPNVYCPNGLVTRAQMATFMSRAYSLPASATDWFTDDNGSVHEPNINRMAEAGITGGCAPGRFCPTGIVTRGQMAAFLHRAETP